MRRWWFTWFMVQAFALANAQIVADHSIVDHYAEIPQQYIDAVKTMLVSIPGESHASGYRIGQNLLEQMDPTCQVETYYDFDPPAATDQYLRLGMHRQAGEDFFFSQSQMDVMKGEISDQNATGNPFQVMGFAWCWDMTDGDDPGGSMDPVFQVHWAGRSEGGPDGSLRWGLDAGDEALTGNSVNMDTYLAAVESYIQYCTQNSLPTQWIFTTGPVDNHGGSENGFQREIKHDYIRDYVAADPDRILFDYADILCWNNEGEQYMADWNDGGTIRSHAQIHPDNMMDYDGSWNPISFTEDGDHIGEVGAVRLAKAMWWLLARMAGWDGNILVREIQLSSEGGAGSVETGSQLQFYSTVVPSFATNPAVTWSVINGTGTATISADGLLSGGLPGTVQVVATATDGSGVSGNMSLTIAGPSVPVSSITVSTAGGVTEVEEGSTLQCSATVLPANASNPAVIWSMINGGGTATVSAGGLLSALTAGSVKVVATATDGTGVADTVDLTIMEPFVAVSSITLSTAGGVTLIEEGNSLQCSATVLPVNATNQVVAWSIINGSGTASVSTGGLVSALTAGTVEVVASATDGSGVADTVDLTIAQSIVLVSSITVAPAGGITEIEEGNTLQYSATVLPANATHPDLAWSVIAGNGTASVSTGGLLSAMTAGTVEVVATATDGSGVADTADLTITEAVVMVSSITVTTAGGTTVVEEGSTLQCSSTVLPVNASNPAVAWSVINGSGTASVSAGGLLTALSSGTVEVVATATDGSGVADTVDLIIAEAVVMVSSITISTAGGITEIEGGETLQCSATVLPANATQPAVAWSVTDGSGTATISSGGLLTAFTAGTVDVVATATDGSGVNQSLTITITTSVVLVSSITVHSAGNVRVVDMGTTLQFTASILPANATNQAISWSIIPGTGSADISQAGLLTPVSLGTVGVLASALDGSGVSTAFALTVQEATGLHDRQEGPPMTVYPNPSPGIFYLKTGTMVPGRVEVFAVTGSKVLELIPEPGDELIEVDLSDQHPGAYYLRAFSGEDYVVLRIIVNR